jgi:uncharacterized protein
MNIYLPHLASRKPPVLTVDIEENFPSLSSLTPVRGQVTVSHRGSFLEIQGHAQTITSLTCHRCLSQYNHRLEIEIDEIIWIKEIPKALEEELEDLDEHLPEDGTLEVHDLVYQHLSLNLPFQNICDPNCVGILSSQSEAPVASDCSNRLDQRWEALEKLKKKLKQD